MSGCDCGGKIAGTTHARWCSTRLEDVAKGVLEQAAEAIVRRGIHGVIKKLDEQIVGEWVDVEVDRVFAALRTEWSKATRDDAARMVARPQTFLPADEEHSDGAIYIDGRVYRVKTSRRSKPGNVRFSCCCHSECREIIEFGLESRRIG